MCVCSYSYSQAGIQVCQKKHDGFAQTISWFNVTMGHPCDTSHKSDSCHLTPVPWYAIVPVGLLKPARLQASSPEAGAVTPETQPSIHPEKELPPAPRPPQTFTQLISPGAHAHCSLHSHGTWCYTSSQAEHTHSRIWAACQNCPVWKSPPLKYKPLAQEPCLITCWVSKCRGRDFTQVTNPMQSPEQELRNKRHNVLNCTPSGRDAELSQVPLPGGSAALTSWLTSLVSQSSLGKEKKCWTLLSVVCLCCQTIKVCFWVCWIWGSFSPIDNCSKHQNSNFR